MNYAAAEGNSNLHTERETTIRPLGRKCENSYK